MRPWISDAENCLSCKYASSGAGTSLVIKERACILEMTSKIRWRRSTTEHSRVAYLAGGRVLLLARYIHCQLDSKMSTGYDWVHFWACNRSIMSFFGETLSLELSVGKVAQFRILHYQPYENNWATPILIVHKKDSCSHSSGYVAEMGDSTWNKHLWPPDFLQCISLRLDWIAARLEPKRLSFSSQR